ncbi:PspA/IM30 family protein [Nostocaceae cyanobacterium CENA357]|uniref:PspA/IM30 family protein n=1 Tax=Atlanticothrix silvestris CENA357 TaxID=1725252 RepID=A0A8J7HIP2_9CYAN|nr:PspA/IM30 family protein [Atlanticothrix silvestris]MBH8555839.1 PspA/IM30 family protein [Atlanticothrix silvestris CENA357]
MALYDPTQPGQNALKNLRAATASVSTAQKIAQRDYAQAQAEADKWSRRYKLALKEGREDLAPQAKFQKERYQAIASRLKTLIDDQTPQLDTIKNNLASWESKISEAQNRILCSNPNITSEYIEEKTLQIEASLEETLQSDNFDEGILIDLEDVDEELKRLKEEVSSLLKPQNKSKDKKGTLNTLVNAISETREAVNKAVTNKEYIQKYYAQVKNEAEEWHKKAQVALENNDDNLAIQAILSKTVQSKIAIALKTQLQQQEATIILLQQNLTALESLKETTASSSSTVVNLELESLRKQLEQM